MLKVESHQIDIKRIQLGVIHPQSEEKIVNRDVNFRLNLHSRFVMGYTKIWDFDEMVWTCQASNRHSSH